MHQDDQASDPRVPWWMRPRWRLIGLFWGFQAVAAYTLSMPVVAIVFADSNGPFLTVGSLLFVLLFFGLQLLFLLPIRRPTIKARGVPIHLSIAIGGLLAGGLAAAAAYALWQFADLYLRPGALPWWLPPAVLAASWLAGTPLLLAFCRRGPRDHVLHRLSTGLFLGTIIEAAAIIPLDVLVRRREECICGTGTFVALAICSVVGLFVLGPAVLLPLLLPRRRRWSHGRCEVCGYDMKGQRKAEVCPECGSGWRGRASVSG